MTSQDRLKDYDSEPVRYCARCYSLKIRYEEIVDSECCSDCGCTDIMTSTIDVWEEKYSQRYGKKFTEKGSNPRNSYIFKMPLDKLKQMVVESPLWKKIIGTLYPGFPGGLGKTDSLILLFDKITKDGRLDDLKMLLYKLSRQ